MGAERPQEDQGAAAAMAGRAPPAREKSSFAVTCSLLSQYLKDNKGGLQGLGGFGMPPPPPTAKAGAFRPPTTMNLLSALDAPAAEEPNDAARAATTDEAKEHDQQTGENPREAAAAGEEEEAQQLTIFYGGQVVVFDKFPSTKVKDLLQIVNASGDTAAAQPSQNSLPDMPIARRNSLHRFLEKRKGRITAKAPYQVTSSPVGVDASKQSTASDSQAGDLRAWLEINTLSVSRHSQIHVDDGHRLRGKNNLPSVYC